MDNSHFLILSFIFITMICRGQINQSFIPKFQESKSTTHKIPQGQQFTFGYLEVPEIRSNPQSQTIKIPVYIFKSRNPNPAPDPIIYTVGGPGSTTMPSAQYMNYYKYLDNRDFILIEQRGNFYAKPHLDCPEWAKAMRLSNLSNDRTKNDSLLLNAAKDCRERLTSSGIDLNGYNTREIAADINDLVQVLGITEYNLLTISYSTKIAQVLIRDYPQRIRSVVMDSPLPLEVNYDEESVINLLESVEKLLSDCESDDRCGSSFPDLKNRFLQYLTEKTLTPLQVNIEDPNTGQGKTFILSGADLITLFTSYSTDMVGEIPFEMNKLLEGDLSSLEEHLSSLFAAPGSGAGMGMRLSVWCSEENPFSSQSIIASETQTHTEVKGMSPAVFKDDVCKIWGVKSAAEIENQPITTNIPILLISGEYDNETPVKWAKSMMDNLNNSYHLIFEGWQHTPTTNWSNQCAMVAANEFFNAPDVKPNPVCLVQIQKTKV